MTWGSSWGSSARTLEAAFEGTGDATSAVAVVSAGPWPAISVHPFDQPGHVAAGGPEPDGTVLGLGSQRSPLDHNPLHPAGGTGICSWSGFLVASTSSMAAEAALAPGLGQRSRVVTSAQHRQQSPPQPVNADPGQRGSVGVQQP